MLVGIPREVKNNEFRVAITPSGVHELARNGHEVYVETDAGVGSSITNEDYVAAGAQILGTAEDVWATGDLILKVKEPGASEYDSMREGQTLFTYLHLVAVAGSDERGGRPVGTAGGCAGPDAGPGWAGCAHGWSVRCVCRQGRRHRRGCLRHERSSHRVGYAGRGPPAGPQRGQASGRG